MDFQKELIAEFDRETAKTRKLLDAIPADVDFTFKPHPKSMVLGRLAGHVVETAGDWASHTLTTDKLEMAPDHKYEPYIPASKAALLERLDRDVAKVKTGAGCLQPRRLEQKLEVRSQRPGMDRRNQVRSLAQLGPQSPHPPPRPAQHLSPPTRQTHPRNVRPLRRQDVARPGWGNHLRVLSCQFSAFGISYQLAPVSGEWPVIGKC